MCVEPEYTCRLSIGDVGFGANDTARFGPTIWGLYQTDYSVQASRQKRIFQIVLTFRIVKQLGVYLLPLPLGRIVLFLYD